MCSYAPKIDKSFSMENADPQDDRPWRAGRACFGGGSGLYFVTVARLLALAGTVLVCLSLLGFVSAIAATSALEPVTIQLRWSHKFQFAGYCAALEKGFYAAESLDVSLREAVPGQDRIAPYWRGGPNTAWGMPGS